MNIFNTHEKLFIKAILTHVSNTYDIELTELLSHFNIKHEESITFIIKTIETQESRCVALVDHNKRCSRKSKEQNFCLTHYKMHSKDKSNVKINNESQLDYNEIVRKMRHARQIPALMYTKLKYIDSKPYIFDEILNELYDFESYAFVGKLDIFNQIKAI
jgi:radical SAM superfamily enzyme with C-terminal helix-hairpin-helix motif